jgi:hypothetical protein
LALQITQIEFDLHLAPGTSETYTFKVINNKSDPQDVSVYLGDWTRTITGENDFLTLNSARWLYAREFKQGDEFDIVYQATIPHGGVSVSGSYASMSPSAQGEISGPQNLLPIEEKVPTVPSEGPVLITRSVESGKEDGTVTVNLHVKAIQAFAGLRIDEVFSSHLDVVSVDSAGGEFTTVNRSCGDWITASPRSFRIEPGEAQSITFQMAVPEGDMSGMYWAMIFVQAAPRPEQREGATILAIERFGVKVYETIPGTSILSGEIRSVRKINDHPLTLEVVFANTGNVQLRPTGTVTVINQMGEAVRTLSIREFPLLPGKEQVLSVVDGDSSSLPAGIYRALVTIDYGGDSLAGGTRDFRVR